MRRTLLVTGSRSITNSRVVTYVLTQILEDLGGAAGALTLLHGGAAGVDLLADEWARGRHLPTRCLRPDFVTYPYRTFGSKAYLIRDRAMVDQADLVVAIWDGVSTGTKYTLEYAGEKGRLHSVWLLADILEELDGGAPTEG